MSGVSADTSEIDAVDDTQVLETEHTDAAHHAAERDPLPIERAITVGSEHDAVWVGSAEGPRVLDRSKREEIVALFRRAQQRQEQMLTEARRNGRRRRNGHS